LLGSGENLFWSQHPDGLVIVFPAQIPSPIAVTFKISTNS
jgi:hypothetical protein